MLLNGSILLQASLLVLISLVSSQHYAGDYEVHDEGEDQSSYEGGGFHPDYSKFYSVDGSSSPLAAQLGAKSEEDGFVTPIDFSNFFSSASFDFGSASGKQEVFKTKDGSSGFVPKTFGEYDLSGFGTQDYFEQAQKPENLKEGEEEEPESEAQPGPSYAPHKDRSSTKNKNSNRQKDVERVPSHLLSSTAETPSHSYDNKPSTLASYIANPTATFNTAINKYNYLPQYYSKYTNVAAASTPYEKYSFQPASENYDFGEEAEGTAESFNPTYGKISSTFAPYEQQSSEKVPKNIKSKNCVKVNKEVSSESGRIKRQPMNCFVCKDPKSGTEYEQCSYSSDPAPKSYYKQSKYSSDKAPADSYRNKRDESESYGDPYDYIKADTHKYYSRPEEFDAEYYQPPKFPKVQNNDYSLDPQFFKDLEAEQKSYSEIQSEQLSKSGDNCKKVDKEGMTCTICVNSKTGGNYEQCSYSTAPKEEKYAYVSETKYDGKAKPQYDKVEEGSENKPIVSESSNNDETKTSKSEQKNNNQNDEATTVASKLVKEESYDPKHYTRSTQEATAQQPQKTYDNSGSANQGQDNNDKSAKDYNFKLFPELNAEEKQQQATVNNPYFADEVANKKSVESVLAEFIKKDRTNCKQAVGKNGMTCYLCVDGNGVQQEECMFVAESKPQATHVAYHEIQKLKISEKPNESETQKSEIATTPEEAKTKRKEFFKKVAAGSSEPSASASGKIEKRVKYKASASDPYQVHIPRELTGVYELKQLSKNKELAAAASNVEEEGGEAEADPREPNANFPVDDEGGLYSADTSPVYSKVLGFTLPKYMLVRTEHEKIFEEFQKSG